MSRVNILWFTSLILSITTVLVGTVSSQWIREYQIYPQHITPRDKLALLNMRLESFSEWYIPIAISMLPVILQASVVLFLVGLIDFIVIVAPSEVSIPVIAVIGLPLIFITVTTVLPSCYWIPSTLLFKINKNAVPSQCPYKSPQSSLFIHLIRTLLVFLSRALDAIMFCYYRLTSHAGFIVRSAFWRRSLSNLIERMVPSNDRVFLRYRQQCHEEIYRKKWRSHNPQPHPDCQWYEKEPLPNNGVKAAPPLYDCIMGIKKLLKKGDNLDPQLASVGYYSIQDLFKFDRSSPLGPRIWHQYLQGLMLNDHLHTSLAFNEDHQEVVPSMILQEETLMTALSLLPHTPENVLALYEHHIRLTHFYLTLPTKTSTSSRSLESVMSLLSRDRIETVVDRSGASLL